LKAILVAGDHVAAPSGAVPKVSLFVGCLQGSLVQMFRRLGIGGECSTELRWKSGREMRGMVGEGRSGVGMVMRLRERGGLVRVRTAGLLRRMS
jgi:hypothetical protein